MGSQGDPPNKRAALSLADVPGAAAPVPGGSGDLLIRLPDRPLGLILRELGTKQAVMMSALSRQWRRVWTQLSDLELDGVDSSVPATVLAIYKAHGKDDIHNLTVSPNQVNARHIAAWLSLAAPLLCRRLHLDNRRNVTRETVRQFLREDEKAMLPRQAFQLPCFQKATEILMDPGFLALALPPAGVFDNLTVMRLEHFWFRGQISIGDTMFPSLQRLTIRRVRGLVELTLNSKSLLNIRLSLLLEIQRLDILAPWLEELEVTFCFYNVSGPVASIDAERLEKLRWEVPCVPELKEMPDLSVLGAPPITTLWSKDICAEFLNFFPEVDHLELQISAGLQNNESLLSMEDITIPHVNTLSLYLETNKHYFEGRVLQLVERCPGIRELNLSFQSRHETMFAFQEQDSCVPGCICQYKPKLWEDKVVQIRSLKEVAIFNYHGAEGEAYFVEQLVRRAPRLKLLRVTSKVEDESLDHIEGICPPGCSFKIVVIPDRSKKE